MRGNLPKTEILTDYKKMWDIFSDPKKEIIGHCCVTENKMLITWRFKDEKDAPQGRTSLAIASFVTAYGRLKLTRLMQEIDSHREGRVLYHDTGKPR